MDEEKWFPKLRKSTTKEMIVNGETFVYKFETGGDQNDWLDHFMVPVFDKKGEIVEYKRSMSKQNECLLMNVIKVPFSKELIGKLLDTKPTKWDDLDRDNRVKALSELDGGMYSTLILKIRANEKQDDDKKKS